MRAVRAMHGVGTLAGTGNVKQWMLPRTYILHLSWLKVQDGHKRHVTVNTREPVNLVVTYIK